MSRKVEQDEMRRGGRIQTQLPFVAHRGAVARRQAETVELQSAVDDLDPRVSPRTQLVREACAGGDPAREDLGLLGERARIVAAVLPFRVPPPYLYRGRAECPLLVARLRILCV